MIARITGNLIELDSENNIVLLEVSQIAYELMVPGYAVSDLSSQLRRDVTLYCLEYYEATGNPGGNLIPRLIGFPRAQDKAFFQRFISVKGIGIRKALRALAKPLAEVAYSIENNDTNMLTTLPEIGKRTAQQIVAELKGKMGDFALEAVHKAGVARKPMTDIEREALEILLQLGERRSEAEEFISRATGSDEEIKTTDALVQYVYRIKAGTV